MVGQRWQTKPRRPLAGGDLAHTGRHAFGPVGHRSRDPLALKSQYGAVLAAISDLYCVWCDRLCRRDVCEWLNGIFTGDTGDVGHHLGWRRHTNGAGAERLAVCVDDFLLGVVDRFYALRRAVSGPRVAGPDDSRVRSGRHIAPCHDVFRLVLYRRRHRARPRTHWDCGRHHPRRRSVCTVICHRRKPVCR